MAGKYDHRAIEKKWQKVWEDTTPYTTPEDSSKKKEYLLIEFPYPSGDGLHVGHIRSWTALDVVARKHRAEGKNVLYPIGWDAFGLPAENYAIKTGVHPKITTKENTDNFRRQIKSIGISFDWSREINTTDPAYYTWTQWIFLQLFKKGLAYKSKTPVNWCPKDKVVLANEEVVDGACERCGTPVEKREKEQWMLAITKYAQRLYDDLDTVDYISAAKAGQRNWIGPSTGAEIDFSIKDSGERLKIFTTRPDTLFGATYMVVAPEHVLVQEWLEAGKIQNKDEVTAYIQAAKSKSDIERSAEGKEKTGVLLQGMYAINPATKKEIPLYVADYVLGGYGTGAIMAVPAHDERDYEFAEKYNLPITQVVEPLFVQTTEPGAFKEGEPITEKDGIIAIIKHWSEDKYIALKWKKVAWSTFLTGGIEEGHTVEETVRKETQEETGFKNMTFKGELGIVYGLFYHVPKQKNQLVRGHIAYVELTDGERTEVSQEENDIHEIQWLTPDELRKSLTPDTHQYALSLWQDKNRVYTGEGKLTNSNEFNGLSTEEAKKKITEAVGGKTVTTFKLRDWVFGRQRYWGEPIPMIHCEKDGWVPVPEKDLPVLLPETDTFLPGADGESLLATMDAWVNTTCPTCGGPAKRETDVMPQWAGSSWYYLRYADPQNKDVFASKEKLNYWTPVDWYNGGMEHTTLHLLYSRFWHKFLFDIGEVPSPEPYAKRTSHGLILAEGGVKMSKSLGNTVSPDTLVEKYGADSLRLYEMFIGPFDQPVAWNTSSIMGVRRFIEKVWSAQEKVQDVPLSAETDTLMHQTIKKVTEDIEQLKMNTAVSAQMIFLNHLTEQVSIPKIAYGVVLQLLAPFAPHVAEEIVERMQYEKNLLATWPTFDASKLASNTAMISVQINGKVRASVEIPATASEEEVFAVVRSNPTVVKWLGDKREVKAIYVKGKVVSFVLAAD